MALIRTLRTAKVTLTRQFYMDEVPEGATGSVTVTITRLDGTAVESGAATGPDANQVYTYTFGGRDVLDRLQVVWAATINGDSITIDSDQLEIVGGYYFSIAQGRKSDKVLTSPTLYPTSDLMDRRLETEDEAEGICGQAFVPRFEREVLDGRGESFLRLKWPWIRAIRSISVRSTPSAAYIPMTSDQLANVVGGDDGVIRIDQGISWPTTGYWWGAIWPMGRRNIIVEYEHGLDFVPPDMVRGALLRFKSLALINKSPLPDRAERIATTETGVVLLASASADKTGIPEADAAYARHPDPRAGFG